MVEIKKGVESEEVRQAAKYTLFVEGGNEEAIDPQVLTHLLNDLPIQVKPLGPSSYIKSAAEALHKHHPHYFFLIDRDHHREDLIERCWKKFPDESTCNLLIWRRRELENYFLIPEYLIKTHYKHCSLDALKNCILETANKRIFLDAANIVIVSLREELKKKWIETFTNISDFKTKEMALEQLLAKENFQWKRNETHEKLHKESITQMFEVAIETLLGGQSSLDFAHGSWLALVSGKDVLPTVINKCFQVNVKRKILQGPERLMEVVRSLLKLDLQEQPDDFIELHGLMARQVKRG